jgi:diguanylate cyclase (GGDEF)-like protein
MGLLVREMRWRDAAIPLAVWIACSAAMLIATGTYVTSLWHAEREAAFERADGAAALTLQALQRRQAVARSTFRILNVRHQMQLAGNTAATAAIDAELDNLRQEPSYGMFNVGYTNLDGITTWWSDKALIGINLSSRDYFQKLAAAPEQEAVVGDPFYSPAAKHWTTPVIRRTRDAGGVPDGYAIIVFDPIAMGSELAQIDSAPGRTLLLARLANGHVSAANRNLLTYLGVFNTRDHADSPMLAAAQKAMTGRLAYTGSMDGRALLAAFRVNPGIQTVAIATLDERREMRHFWQQAATVAAAVMVVILAGLIVGLAWIQSSRLRAGLRVQAMQDPLTGLRNRRSIEVELARLAGRQRVIYSCLLFDLDHFKQINDAFGHATGDAVLKAVARLLRDGVRRGDLVCRWGGEELLVVLVGCCPPEAVRRAEELRADIAGLRFGSFGNDLRVTASIGVSCCPQHGADLGTLSQAADTALYQAKQSGRNRVRMAAPEAA